MIDREPDLDALVDVDLMEFLRWGIFGGLDGRKVGTEVEVADGFCIVGRLSEKQSAGGGKEHGRSGL